MADLIAGVCYVKVDGEQLLLKGSLSCTVSDEAREPVMANGRVVGYKTTPQAPTISGSFVINSKFPMEKLKNGTDMTVIAELANGRTFTLGGAFITDAIQVGGDDSDTTLTFVGESGKWS